MNQLPLSLHSQTLLVFYFKSFKTSLQSIVFAGAIDSSYIRISQPLQHLSSYTNRKKFTAISLQAVCDAEMRFTDVSTGWPSSMNDARIYKRSSISRALPQQLLDTDYHLIGDSAYPLQIHLMTPYKKYGALNEVSFSCPFLQEHETSSVCLRLKKHSTMPYPQAEALLNEHFVG